MLLTTLDDWLSLFFHDAQPFWLLKKRLVVQGCIILGQAVRTKGCLTPGECHLIKETRSTGSFLRVLISNTYSRLRLIEYWRDRRKISDSAKYSIKRKHASIFFTAGYWNIYSFTRNIGLADILLSEVYCRYTNRPVSLELVSWQQQLRVNYQLTTWLQI